MTRRIFMDPVVTARGRTVGELWQHPGPNSMYRLAGRKECLRWYGPAAMCLPCRFCADSPACTAPVLQSGQSLRGTGQKARLWSWLTPQCHSSDSCGSTVSWLSSQPLADHEHPLTIPQIPSENTCLCILGFSAGKDLIISYIQSPMCTPGSLSCLLLYLGCCILP
jgi:hypothetical protein